MRGQFNRNDGVCGKASVDMAIPSRLPLHRCAAATVRAVKGLQRREARAGVSGRAQALHEEVDERAHFRRDQPLLGEQFTAL
jgi:hypothetical protein